MKTARGRASSVFFLLLLFAWPGHSATQALRWQVPEDSEIPIVGYRLYLGSVSGEYTTVFDLRDAVPVQPGVLGALIEIPQGQAYYGAMASYDEAGNESELSAEIRIQSPLSPQRGSVSLGMPAAQELDERRPFETEALLSAVGATYGLDQAMASPSKDPRLFIAERTGTIRVLEGGLQKTKSFLELGDQSHRVDGGGLISMAFDPDYGKNGHLFVSHTDADGYFRLTRWTVRLDPYQVDAASSHTILEILLPYRGNPGGGLAFGPDGHLYVAIGDGGGEGDPSELAQDGRVLQGKLLRIDVAQPPSSDSIEVSSASYRIPGDNPFVGHETIRGEIWALGLRNAQKISIDGVTGDLWVADRGERLHHEINWSSEGEKGGQNFGWDLAEGTECRSPTSEGICAESPLVEPALEYSASQPDCGVSGGYVYRGSVTRWQGLYLFVDECRGILWSYDGARQSLENWNSVFLRSGLTGVRAKGLGQGGSGEIFIFGSDAGLYKLGSGQPECSDGVDNDGDGQIDYPDDLACEKPSSRFEVTLCDDGLDNDGDGFVDRDDSKCTEPYRNAEVQWFASGD